MLRPGFLGRVVAATSLVVCAITPACLRRDVAELEPSTKLAFENLVPQPSIDKIDLLLMVDNSASMADKQKLLAHAVPDLVRGLVQPKCVDKKTRLDTGVRSDPTKPEKEHCPAGSRPAFTPITDMHIGVLTSSLGSFGGTTNGAPSCANGPRSHGDDHGHLVARGEGGAPIPEAGNLGFLAWYPKVPRNDDKERHPDPPVPAIGSLDALGSAFGNLIVGVGQDGCGLEAQLESVYRFLVQPDPWTEVGVTDGKASYGPKGQVDTDLLAQRAAFLRPDSLVAVVMLTDEEDSSPDPLAFGAEGWKKRFGVDPQFPIQRYVDALTASKVPSRDAEHVGGRYVGAGDCTNPLFAAQLPTKPNDSLCKLPRGPRSKDQVLFALIGGVPNTLLPEKGSKAESDWTKIVGKAPERWDETGIDPHMVVSIEPRKGLAGPGAANDSDPVNGRDWSTNGGDLQYACTFPLVEFAADGTTKPASRSCVTGDVACDCLDAKGQPTDSPLCDPKQKGVQVRGKAYPTRRELMLAKELGDRAVVASLCPRQVADPNADDFGYRPAATRIVDRLGDALVGSCLPRPLTRASGEDVPCLVLAQLATKGSQAECERRGLEAPSDEVVRTFHERRRVEDGEDVSAYPVCKVPFRDVAKGETCSDDDDLAFCAVQDAPGLSCSDALIFTKGMSKLVGARFSLQCVQLAGTRRRRRPSDNVGAGCQPSWHPPVARSAVRPAFPDASRRHESCTPARRPRHPSLTPGGALR